MILDKLKYISALNISGFTVYCLTTAVNDTIDINQWLHFRVTHSPRSPELIS